MATDVNQVNLELIKQNSKEGEKGTEIPYRWRATDLLQGKGNNTIQELLKVQGRIEKTQAAYLKGKEAIFVFDEEMAEEVALDWTDKASEIALSERETLETAETGETNLETSTNIDQDDQGVAKEFLPSALLNKLLGVSYIPFEVGSIQSRSEESLEAGSTKLSGNFRITFPKMSQNHAQKLQYFLLASLKKNLSPQNIEEFLHSTSSNTKTWAKFLETLPDLPAHLQGESSFAEFNEACKKEGIFYSDWKIETIKTSKGLNSEIAYQLTCDNFEDFMTCVNAVVEVHTDNLKREARSPADDLSLAPEGASVSPTGGTLQPHLHYVVLSEKFKDLLRTLQHAVVIDFSIVKKMIGAKAKAETSKGNPSPKSRNIVPKEGESSEPGATESAGAEGLVPGEGGETSGNNLAGNNVTDNTELEGEQFEQPGAFSNIPERPGSPDSEINWMKEAICRVAKIKAFEDFYDNKKVAAVERFNYIVEVAAEAEKNHYDKAYEELNKILSNVWLESRVCQLAGVRDEEEFTRTKSKGDQIDILYKVMQEAEVLDNKEGAKEAESWKNAAEQQEKLHDFMFKKQIRTQALMQQERMERLKRESKKRKSKGNKFAQSNSLGGMPGGFNFDPRMFAEMAKMFAGMQFPMSPNVSPNMNPFAGFGFGMKGSPLQGQPRHTGRVDIDGMRARAAALRISQLQDKKDQKKVAENNATKKPANEGSNKKGKTKSRSKN